MHQRKIDTSLNDRRGILRQLERVKEENISLDELEEIGGFLKKNGKSALRPLVRNLWLERRGDLISRYTYLLDFFEDEVWIDQLIQIALKRRDLDHDAKAAILAALEGYGVDVSHPPFSYLFAGIANSASISVPEVLDRGEEGLISFMEEFLLYPQEIRLMVIGRLPEVGNPKVVDLLQILLRLDDGGVTPATLAALGRIREKASAELLRKYLSQAAEPLAGIAARNLRRLSFLGVDAGNLSEQDTSLPFHICCAGPPDGDGYRTLFFSRTSGGDTFAILCLQIHELIGIVGARGSASVAGSELEEELTELHGEEEVVPVEADYALCLMQDALYRNRETGTELPAEFYVRSGMFSRGQLVPTIYEPPLQPTKAKVRLTNDCLDEIADDDFFSCWFMTDSSVYGYAAEWRDLQLRCSGRELTRGLELILARFCQELFPHLVERIHRRLLLVADLMRRVGRDPRLAEKTAALAGNVAEFKLPYHFHPFLRRLALESMDMAREALEEGFDTRRYEPESGEEWDD
ncbi:HEAT repeat domain-containing protein [Geotalea toluenoxydans]